MNDQTKMPKTRTVTDASGKTYVRKETDPETRRIMDQIVEEHGEALKRLADR